MTCYILFDARDKQLRVYGYMQHDIVEMKIVRDMTI